MSGLRIGYLPGVFDLFHVGHLHIIQRAKYSCDYLIVGVLKDGSWKRKETFIPLNERIEIIAACKYVDEVIIAPTNEYEAWNTYHFNVLFAGEDHKDTARYIEYEAYFQTVGVEIIYFPRDNTTNSTQIRALINKGLADD